jgi:F-type H+-transporting ATPase subunit epsilon
MPLLLEIITPEGKALSTNATSVTFPTASGELTILPGHQPIIGQTTPGELSYLGEDGARDIYAIDSGFFRLVADKLSFLVEGATDTDKIDLAAIEDARERAQTALADAQKLDPAQVEELEQIIRFSMAQKLVKQKH